MSTPDPRRDLDTLLRQCVQCGLCLPHCATWLATGSEVHSPRGRLVLLGEVLDGGGDDSFLTAFDSCIGCMACATACPSGVSFDLLERGRTMAAGRLPVAAAVPAPLLRRLDRPWWLALLRRAAAAGRGVLRLLGGRQWRRRLDGWSPARLVGSTPRSPERDEDLVALLDSLTGRHGSWQPPVVRDAAGPVVFFGGCANEGLLPGTSRRARQLLAWSGRTVREVPGQECCGALAAHGGRPGRAAELRRRNQEILKKIEPTAPLVVEAAGCGLELGTYDPEVSSRVQDLSVVLAAVPPPVEGPVPLRVAVHDPCHLRHGQGVVAEPRRLLASLPGLTLLEAEEPDVCCGSGGVWSLHHPEMSADLGRRKARLLAATGADLVVTSNPGCLGQIADGLALEAFGLPILPLSDLLWYAALRR